MNISSSSPPQSPVHASTKIPLDKRGNAHALELPMALNTHDGTHVYNAAVWTMSPPLLYERHRDKLGRPDQLLACFPPLLVLIRSE